MSVEDGRPTGLPARAVIGLLTGYRQWVSPLLAPRCRFAPSCSEYGLTAVQRHGAGRGSVLTLRRVLRCHPFHAGGYDPVPPRRTSATSSPSGAAGC